MAQAAYKTYMSQLEKTLDEYFGKKAPILPQNVKEIIVTIAPYLVILSVIFTIPAIFILLGLGGIATMMSPIGGIHAMSIVPTIWLSILLLIPVVVFEVMAIPGLFAKKTIGWNYIYWAKLISFVSALLQFNIVGAIINALIGFYLLFQVKNLYK